MTERDRPIRASPRSRAEMWVALIRLVMLGMLVGLLVWQPFAAIRPSTSSARPHPEAATGLVGVRQGSRVTEVEIGPIGALTSPDDVVEVERQAAAASLREQVPIEPAAGETIVDEARPVAVLEAVWNGLMSLAGLRVGNSAADLAQARSVVETREEAPRSCPGSTKLTVGTVPCGSLLSRSGALVRKVALRPGRREPGSHRVTKAFTAIPERVDQPGSRSSEALERKRSPFSVETVEETGVSLEMEVDKSLRLGVEGQLRRPAQLAAEAAREALLLFRLRMLF